MTKLKINICKNLILSLKSHTLTIIGILGILINEVEKFNFVNWNLGQTFFGLNLKNNGVKSLNLTKIERLPDEIWSFVR